MTMFEVAVRDPNFPDLDGRTGQVRCSRDAKFWWKLVQTLNGLGLEDGKSYIVDTTRHIFSMDSMACMGAMCRGVWKKARGSKEDPTARAWLQAVLPVGETVEELEGGEVELPEDFEEEPSE